MIENKVLEKHLAEFLNIDAYQDYCPNGLQVTGKKEIKKIITGVTACETLIDKAIEEKADAIIVHHGYFWKNENPCLVGMKYQRIKKLLAHDINLFAYHLPLDGHETVGNNVQLAKKLNINIEGEIAVAGGKNILMRGTLKTPVTATAFCQTLEATLQRTPLHISAQSDGIKSIAWCTGAGQDFLTSVAEQGIDAFLTGEVSERTVHEARELGVHFFAAGHHATERYGIQVLGQYLSQSIDLSVSFIDIDNPV